MLEQLKDIVGFTLDSKDIFLLFWYENDISNIYKRLSLSSRYSIDHDILHGNIIILYFIDIFLNAKVEPVNWIGITHNILA